MKSTFIPSIFFYEMDPITLNRSLAVIDRCQRFCVRTSDISSRFIVGVLLKDTCLICAIAINIIIGLGKLALCITQICYAIPLRLYNTTSNYQDTGKESLVHLGFSGFYLTDIFISFSNIFNKYPGNILKDIEGIFAGFLYGNDPLFLALLRGSDKSLTACQAMASNYKNPSFIKAFEPTNAEEPL